MSEERKVEEKEEKIEIEVLDDTPAQDKGRPKRDPAVPEAVIPPPDSEDDLKEYSESVRQRIKRLRYEYHEERRAKEAAVRQNEEAVKFARKVMEDNERLKTLVQTRDKDVIDQARGRVDAEMDTVKRQLHEAITAGKTEDAVKAQAEMARIAAQRELLGGYANQQRPERQQQQPVVQQQPIQQQFQPQPQDHAPDPRAVKWLRANRWFGDDEEMTGYAYGVHEKLIKREGIDPRSDDYYKRIDEAMKMRFPEKFEKEGGLEVEVQKPAPQARSIVAAPSRGASAGGPRKVQIPASAAAIAKRLGLTLEQYAEQYIKEYGNG